MTPLCSFVIPAYNSAAFLTHAIESAQKQTYPNIEIVVVDDGSTDSTEKVMRFLVEKDARISYIKLPKNMGRSEARNIGNKAARGEFILVLDADDIAYPDRARLTVEKLRKCDFVNGAAQEIDVIGNLLGVYRAEVFNKERALREKVNRMVHSTCAYRKEIALKFPYRSGEPSKLGLDDWAFQLEVALSGAKMDVISVEIGAYRDLNTGVSKTRDHKAVEAFKTAFIEALKVPA